LHIVEKEHKLGILYGAWEWNKMWTCLAMDRESSLTIWGPRWFQ
jgi:hypothetical protein